VIDRRLGDEHEQLGDVVQVDAPLFVPSAGVAPHAEELRTEFVRQLGAERDSQRALFAGGKFDPSRDAVPRAVGPRVVDAARDADLLGTDVLDVHRQVLERRKVPAALGCLERNARPSVLASGRHAQGVAAVANGGVSRLDRGEVELGAEAEEHLILGGGSKGPQRPRAHNASAKDRGFKNMGSSPVGQAVPDVFRSFSLSVFQLG